MKPAQPATLGLLRASHPEPTAAVTAVAIGLAVAVGRPALGVVAVGLAVLAGQLSVGWHNDWLDAERDVAAGREDKPVVVGVVTRTAVGRAAAAAAVAVVPLSYLSGWRAGTAHVVAVAAAWAYNARLKASVFSFVPYGVAFPLLVSFVTLSRNDSPWPTWWALVAAALIGVGAHLANAVPDLADDAAAGVRGLPHRLGRAASVQAAAALLLAASALVALAPGRPGVVDGVGLAAAVAVVAAGLVLDRARPEGWLFRAAMVVALVDVALLLARGSAVARLGL